MLIESDILYFKGKMPNDDMHLSSLNLKKNTKIMMMGTREENLVCIPLRISCKMLKKKCQQSLIYDYHGVFKKFYGSGRRIQLINQTYHCYMQ